ncbi:low-density lipoprotein receptor-related protein 6-like [Anneissia japonica]|uniref:low-density lipoprotein receptor-related protein 6-like n=1 Tax=Anneissia japonica TaxID=1529436 RepID=UPI0014256477|nr:low-density lipoprotein receptor-related protein 6-like [Anneissia japonica]
MTNYFGEGEAMIVDTGLERPSGIACHPIKGYLFWTELGNLNPARIERSSMSGTNRVTIVTGVSEPRSIAVDTIANRIYWTDNSAADNKIESSDLNGDNRRTEVSEPTSDSVFDSISVDEDYIFVSMFTSSKDVIRYYKKTTPIELFVEYKLDSEVHVLDLCVTGYDIQPKPATLPCDGNTCGDFCVSAAEGKQECVCRENYFLHPNGTCSIDWNFLHPPLCIIGRTHAMSIFDPTLLHYDLEYKQQYIHDFLSGERIITAVTSDIYSNMLFFAEENRKSIYVIKMEDGQIPLSIRSNISRVDGMAVDWVSLNVYWVDYDQNQLLSTSYDGKFTKVLFDDVTKSRAIAVDPSARLIFWTEETFPTKLVSCNLEGTNRHDVMNTRLQSPSGIALDYAHKRVYIVDNKRIYFTNYDGTEQEILGASMYPAKDVTIFQDFLIIAESYEPELGLVEAIHKISGDHEGLMYLNTSVYAIDTVDESTQPMVDEESTGNSSTAGISSTVFVAVGAFIIVIIIIIILLFIRRWIRSKKDQGAEEPFSSGNTCATHGIDGQINHIEGLTSELKSDAPVSTVVYSINQTIEENINTNPAHQFNNPNTIAFYPISEPHKFTNSSGFAPNVLFDYRPPPYAPPEDPGSICPSAPPL